MFLDTRPNDYTPPSLLLVPSLGSSRSSSYLHFLDFDKHAGRRNNADDGVVRRTFK